MVFYVSGRFREAQSVVFLRGPEALGCPRRILDVLGIPHMGDLIWRVLGGCEGLGGPHPNDDLRFVGTAKEGPHVCGGDLIWVRRRFN